MHIIYTADQGYSVVLPEKINSGKWNVYKSLAIFYHSQKREKHKFMHIDFLTTASETVEVCNSSFTLDIDTL